MTVVRSLGQLIPRVDNLAFLAETAVVVGDVEIGALASIWYGAVLRGDVGAIAIGERTNIQDNVCIHMTHAVSNTTVGGDVIVGHGAVLHGALIEDHALVGINSIVMDNARIGEGAWVAAGSVVPPGMIVPAHTLVRGAPARVVRPVKEAEKSWAKQAVERYLELARLHRSAVTV